MRSHISRSFEHTDALRRLNSRMREFARQTIGEVPLPQDPTAPSEVYPADLPMNEELRIAIDSAESPLRELAEAMTWLEQTFGTEVAGPAPETAPHRGQGNIHASKF